MLACSKTMASSERTTLSGTPLVPPVVAGAENHLYPVVNACRPWRSDFLVEQRPARERVTTAHRAAVLGARASCSVRAQLLARPRRGGRSYSQRLASLEHAAQARS